MRRLGVVLGGILLVGILVNAGARLALAQKDEFTERFVPAEVISAEEVPYPANALYWGTTVLQLTIDADGAISGVKVVRDFPPYTKLAQTAVKKWKFKPATFDGKPVRSTLAVAFSFSRPMVWNPAQP